MENNNLTNICSGFVSFENCKINCLGNKCGEYELLKDHFKSLMLGDGGFIEDKYILPEFS
jgi:hypothetical protein